MKVVEVGGLLGQGLVGELGKGDERLGGSRGGSAASHSRVVFGELIVVGRNQDLAGGMGVSKRPGDGLQVAAIHRADGRPTRGLVEAAARGVALADQDGSAVVDVGELVEAALHPALEGKTLGALRGDVLRAVNGSRQVLERDQRPAGINLVVADGGRRGRGDAFPGQVRVIPARGAWAKSSWRLRLTLSCAADSSAASRSRQSRIQRFISRT